MNYNELLLYIPYFESDEKKYEMIVKDKAVLPYCSYSDKVIEFIKLLYRLDVLDKNYLANYDKIKEKYHSENKLDIIRVADLEELLTIMTFYVRGDRFCDGMLAEACDKKILLEILRRIEYLQKQSTQKV